MKLSKIPERLGKYPISGILGRGAMGAVYKAFDPDIKAAGCDQDHPLGSAAGGRPERIGWRALPQRGPSCRRLTHPGIVAVYEYGQSDECVFIAMEYVEGSDLREYFARKTVFEEADIVSIMVQLLDALGHAHERRVWHRDIKPANLIITNDGRLKVADFGVARIEASELPRRSR